jgi:hypothetical protein
MRFQWTECGSYFPAAASAPKKASQLLRYNNKMSKNHFINQKLGKRMSRRQELAKSKAQQGRKSYPKGSSRKSSPRG